MPETRKFSFKSINRGGSDGGGGSVEAGLGVVILVVVFVVVVHSCSYYCYYPIASPSCEKVLFFFAALLCTPHVGEVLRRGLALPRHEAQSPGLGGFRIDHPGPEIFCWVFKSVLGRVTPKLKR